MEKNQLLEELKNLQKEVFVAERKAKQTDAKRVEASKAYNVATEEQKPDALIRVLEADAKSAKPFNYFRQVKLDFEAAKNAYLKLFSDEQQ